MGTAFIAYASNTVIEFSTRAIVGAAIITIVTILAVTYYRNNKQALAIMYGLLMASLIITSIILGSFAVLHINSITNWSIFSL